MSNNIIDLNEQLDAAYYQRDADELERRVAQGTETYGRYFAIHAARLLAQAVLAHDGRLSNPPDIELDHIWYLRECYGDAILEWAQLICPDYEPEDGKHW